MMTFVWSVNMRIEHERLDVVCFGELHCLLHNAMGFFKLGFEG